MTTDRENVWKGDYVNLQDGAWKDQNLPYITRMPGFNGRHSQSDLTRIGVGIAGRKLAEFDTDDAARTIALRNHRYRMVAKSATMTVAEFVEDRFVPGHVLAKGPHGRLYYRSMLKHIIEPELVAKIFAKYCTENYRRLIALEEWPYIGYVPLARVRSVQVQDLLAAAHARGYSGNTVLNIRNAIGRVFAYATEQLCFSGENPADTTQVRE